MEPTTTTYTLISISAEGRDITSWILGALSLGVFVGLLVAFCLPPITRAYVKFWWPAGLSLKSSIDQDRRPLMVNQPDRGI